MPAPTNITALLATDLGSFPASVSQGVYDSGTTYTVWYKFTAEVGQNYAGVWGYGGLGQTYSPTLSVWTGPAATPVAYPVDFPVSNQNQPLVFPVSPGTEYFLKFLKNGDINPSNLAIEAEYSPTDAAQAGDILVNDDILGFGAVIFDPTADYTVRRYIFPFIAGEGGDALTGPVRYLFSSIDDPGTAFLELYDVDFAFLLSIPFPTGGFNFIGVRASQAQGLFYVTDMGNGIDPAKVYTVDSDGIKTLVATLDDKIETYVTPSNNAGTILYVSGVPSDFFSNIQRWDIPGAAWLSDLAPTETGFEVIDLLVLADDTILALYSSNTGPLSCKVIHYDTDGTILHTYTSFSVTNVAPDRLMSALDDPASFWIWTQYGTGANIGKNDFWNIDVATGATITHRVYVQFNGGSYAAPYTSTPLARFGNSNSCPAVILRSEVAPIASITVNKVVVPATDTTAFNFTAGGGLSPSSFSLQHGESEVFNPVTPDSGYSIAEEPNSQFTTTIVVSNGDDPDNITIGEGESIIVTVTNILNASGGIYKITPGKRNDTVYNDGTGGTTTDVKIPDPFVDTGYIGD